MSGFHPLLHTSYVVEGDSSSDAPCKPSGNNQNQWIRFEFIANFLKKSNKQKRGKFKTSFPSFSGGLRFGGHGTLNDVSLQELLQN